MMRVAMQKNAKIAKKLTQDASGKLFFTVWM
jgi:hypothetical protein